MRFRKLYFWKTRVGVFFIADRDGRFHPVYDEESYGSYARPEQAAEDLAGGHTFSISGVDDVTGLGISPHLEDWKPMSEWQ